MNLSNLEYLRLDENMGYTEFKYFATMNLPKLTEIVIGNIKSYLRWFINRYYRNRYDRIESFDHRTS